MSPYLDEPDFYVQGMMPFNLFHTLHGEAKHISGSIFAILCESPNQWSVITCNGSHHPLQPIILSPPSTEALDTQLYPYTLSHIYSSFGSAASKSNVA